MGSIISYLAIAVPIFSGVYDSLDGPELSAMISKVINFVFLTEICSSLVY